MTEERGRVASHITTVGDLLVALGRDPNELIGLAESQWLEFKKEPYRLADDAQKQELAKDVSAIANAEEGIIVLGVHAPKAVNSRIEVARSLHPIPDGLVDEKQLQDVIRSRVWPRLDVRIRDHPVAGAQGKLWTIHVGRQSQRDIPFLVTREYLSENTQVGHAFAMYERHASDNVPYKPEQVHSWIREGYSGESHDDKTTPDASLQDQAQAIFEGDVVALSIPDGHLWYFLQAHPLERTQAPTFFDEGPETVRDALQKGTSIRGEWGFNLPTDRPSPTSNDCLRVIWGDDSLVSISRSGIVTALFTQRLLTWGMERHQQNEQVWFNPLALVEITLEFWRFYRSQVLDRVSSPSDSSWRCGMRNLGPPHRAALAKGQVGDLFFHEVREASVDEFDVPWSLSEEVQPEALAFTTLVEVYAKFGLGGTDIPYSDPDERRVTESTFEAMRR